MHVNYLHTHDNHIYNIYDKAKTVNEDKFISFSCYCSLSAHNIQ